MTAANSQPQHADMSDAASPVGGAGSPSQPAGRLGTDAPGPAKDAGEPGEAPAWLSDLAESAGEMDVPLGLRPPPGGGRPSAILILFGTGTHGPDVLLVQRSQTLRRHAGQPAFPGGVIDADDDGPASAALREAAEEAHVDPAGVQVVRVLPDLYISRSGYQVSPVIAWWRYPAPVTPGDPAEVEAVARVPMADLANPANRMTIRYPGGTAGPAFQAGAMLIWGFTAFVLDRLLALGGWELPWDSDRLVDLPAGAVLTGVDGPR